MTLGYLQNSRSVQELFDKGLYPLFKPISIPFRKYLCNEHNVFFAVFGINSVILEPVSLEQAAIDVSSFLRIGNNFSSVAEITYDRFNNKSKLIQIDRDMCNLIFKKTNSNKER